MDETNRTPEVFPKEHTWATEALNKGECAVAYFGGQTVAHIPKNWVEKIGPDAENKIKEIIFSIYGSEEKLAEDGFHLDLAEFKRSYTIELPPQTDWQKQGESTGRVAEFIEKLKQQTI